MQYLTFKNQFSKYIVFSINEIFKLYPGFNRMNLLNWQKKGYLEKLKNGWYVFADLEVDESILFYIANRIYNPSYISLESALYYHGIIPEAVFTVTSVSTLKTQTIITQKSRFKYRNIKTSCYFGYRLVETQILTFKMAGVEKALVDFLYLNHQVKDINDIKYLRLNKKVLLEKLDLQKLSDYAILFNSKSLIKRIALLKKYLGD